MKLKLVVIDLELSKRAKRIAAAVVVPVIVFGAGAVAYANVPHAWTEGDTLTAADLNGNFKAMDDNIATLQASMTKAEQSIGVLQQESKTNATDIDLLDARIAALEAKPTITVVDKFSVGPNGLWYSNCTTNSGIFPIGTLNWSGRIMDIDLKLTGVGLVLNLALDPTNPSKTR